MGCSADVLCSLNELNHETYIDYTRGILQRGHDDLNEIIAMFNTKLYNMGIRGWEVGYGDLVDISTIQLLKYLYDNIMRVLENNSCMIILLCSEESPTRGHYQLISKDLDGHITTYYQLISKKDNDKIRYTGSMDTAEWRNYFALYAINGWNRARLFFLRYNDPNPNPNPNVGGRPTDMVYTHNGGNVSGLDMLDIVQKDMIDNPEINDEVTQINTLLFKDLDKDIKDLHHTKGGRKYSKYLNKHSYTRKRNRRLKRPKSNKKMKYKSISLKRK